MKDSCRSRFRKGLVGLTLGLLVVPAAVRADRYVAVRMDATGATQNSAVSDMNESGHTSGYFLINGGHRAVVWVNGTASLPFGSDVQDSYTGGLDDKGQVVGGYEPAWDRSLFHAYRRHGRTGVVDVHDLFGGTYSLAGDIKDIGRMHDCRFGTTPHRRRMTVVVEEASSLRQLAEIS